MASGYCVPCSPVNKPGGPQGKGHPLPKATKPKSPGAKSNPSGKAK